MGGKGDGLQKDAQRVANVSQLTAMPAPFQTTLRRLSGGLLGIAGSERGAAPQGFQGLLDAWHSAKLAAGADAAAASASLSLLRQQRRESVSLLKIFAREI